MGEHHKTKTYGIKCPKCPARARATGASDTVGTLRWRCPNGHTVFKREAPRLSRDVALVASYRE